MCGILGRFHRAPAARPPLAESDLARLSHRGPDGRGVFTNAHVQLGHTRLAIIDLSDGGRQPMSFDSGRIVTTFNGEIYNYRELKSELAARGERFLTSSDTEVLLAAYKVWGCDCVRRLRGMFAFVIWDEARRSLFLARDRCGEKPLFYHVDSDCFTFASELKALLPLLGQRPALNAAVADSYLHYQYAPEPQTLLQGVHKLAAAHWLQISVEGWRVEPARYWNVEDVAPLERAPADAREISAQIRASLDEAVALSLRADVPVGVALSGGLDSGAIAALAQKHYGQPMHAISVGYPGRPTFDERDQARALAGRLGMVVHEVELATGDFVDFFPQLVRIMDEPIADPAAFGHYAVPKAAADLGLKVLLTGIGGDELFWGYDWVVQALRINLRRPGPLLLSSARCIFGPASVQEALARYRRDTRVSARRRHWAGRLLEVSDRRTPADQLHFYVESPEFADVLRVARGLYGRAMDGVPEGNAFGPTGIGRRTRDRMPAAVLRLLFDTWLTSNSLTLGDRVSMGVGVECRLPFLDHRLIERVMSLRAWQPDHELGPKAWLRAALEGVLPDEVRARPKAGFRTPVTEWLGGVVAHYGACLRGGHLVAQGLVDPRRLDDILAPTVSRPWPSVFLSFKLVLLEMWYQSVVAEAVPARVAYA